MTINESNIEGAQDFLDDKMCNHIVESFKDGFNRGMWTGFLLGLCAMLAFILCISKVEVLI